MSLEARAKLAKLPPAVVFAVSLALTGCGSSDMGDLQNFITDENIKASKRTYIEPLPEVKPYETYLYQAEKFRDPFTPPTREEERPEQVASSGIQPDYNRRKETLESYPLDSLRMVGTLQNADEQSAIVNTQEGTIHRVGVGNYMGQNHGKVIRISEQKIDLVEIIPDGLGGWRERETSVALSDE